MKLLRILPLLLLQLSGGGDGVLRAGNPPATPGMKSARLHVVASESLFGTVNQNDATASMRTWIEQIGRMAGFRFEARMEIARSIGQMRQSLKDRAVDLLVLDTPDFLALADARLAEAVMAATSRGQLAAFPYLLLARDASGVRTLAGLRGKRIAVASRTRSNLGLVWLETLLAENRLGRAAGFFGAVDVGYRASSCVLPLFFGKLDACVVDSSNWESLRELNPQLGRLRVVARSEVLLEGLIAMPVEPHPYRRELIDSMLNLHKTPAGEQLGVAFKTGPLIPVGNEPFESVRALCGRHRRIAGPSGDGSGSTAGRLEEVAGKERP